MRAKTKSQTVTYFIQSGEFVKIGKTANVQKRMMTISTASPQRPVFLKACDMPESAAHKIAHELTTRHNGEWFLMNDKMREWIDAIQESKSESAIYRINSKRGRPATGKIHIKLSASAPPSLIAAAAKMAAKRNESFSAYVARAIHAQLLNDQ